MIEVKPPGTRFGPYEVIDLIGSGGMGVVYKARDTRLLREVAIKVLPDSIVHFQASLERFEREARAASALNHPNVVIVHDIGKADEKPYIAMELVEGRTLRELLDGGALPTRRAVEIATQIADALASAHTRGIVHRDLKPENVMVTEDGRVKILDFGLAQLREPLPGEGAVASDALPTSPGVILGTAGYMSPEQAEGRNTDFRSDQFALGAFLYEMVGGHPPFKRPSFAETLTAIIRDEPEPLPIQDPAYDRPIHWIIDRCLAKDPEQRYHSTRDLAKDLERIRLLSLSMASGQPVAAAVSRKFSRRPLAILLAALTLALLALAIPQLSWMIARPTTSHFQKLSFNRGIIWSARFAPDGRSVFYSAAWDGGPFKIYQKYPESPEAIPLPLPSADLLAVSSAGELAVLIDWHIIPPGRTTGVLARVPFTGGTPRRVADDVQYADWSPDGKDLALVRTRAGRSLLEYPLGRTIYQTTGWLDSPRISPDGESIAIFEHPTPVESRGVLIVLDRQGHKRLTSHDWPSSAGLAWAKSGREVWLSAAHERELRAIWAFDLAGRQRLIQTAPGRLSLLDVSADNRALVARESRFFGIGYIDSSGHERDVSHFDSSILADLSSDGRTILFTEFGEAVGGAYEVYRRTLDGSPPEKLGEGFGKAISPDGQKALAVIPTPPERLHLLDMGAGPAIDISGPDLAGCIWATFLPDKRRILFARSQPDRGVQLFTQGLPHETPQPVRVPTIRLEHLQGLPITPDGLHVAALSQNNDLSLFPLSGGTPRLLIEAARGCLPISFSADGKSLFVFRQDEMPTRILRLDLRTGELRPFREIRPSDSAGLHGLPAVRLTPDTSVCAYSYARFLHELYLVGELR